MSFIIKKNTLLNYYLVFKNVFLFEIANTSSVRYQKHRKSLIDPSRIEILSDNLVLIEPCLKVKERSLEVQTSWNKKNLKIGKGWVLASILTIEYCSVVLFMSLYKISVQ